MYTSTPIFKLMGIALAAVFALGAGGAQAEPQSLALVATNGTVDLTCDGALCSAEFSSFCLQADRFSPVRGTKYELADGGEVRLTGITLDGRRMSLDPRKMLKFESLRTHVATRVSMSRRQMAALGLKSVAVDVRENASLVPLPGQGTGNITSDYDLQLLTGSLRILGTVIIDANPTRMAAARIANRMINALPPSGRIGAEAGRVLWRQVVANAGKNDVSSLGKTSSLGNRMARNAYDVCNYLVNGTGVDTLRICLQAQHDKLIDVLNSNYWKAVKTGS